MLRKWEKPFLTTFSDGDPITEGRRRARCSTWCRARRASRTSTIHGGGHFLQEDKGEEIAKVIVDWMRQGRLIRTCAEVVERAVAGPSRIAERSTR